MSLEHAYNQVPNKTVTNFTCGGRMPFIQRDANIIQFENNVFNQMINALPEPEVPSSEIKTPIVRIVSVEDAIRELAELEKQGKINC